MGIADFEKSRGDITLLDIAEQFDQYLDGDIVSTGADDKQSASLAAPPRRNLAIVAGAAAAISGGLLGAPGLEQVPVAGRAVLGTATLMVVTAMELYKDRFGL